MKNCLFSLIAFVGLFCSSLSKAQDAPFTDPVIPLSHPAEKKPQVALVYTVTTPELKADVVREIKQQVGQDVRMAVYEIPEAFNSIRQAGYVTPQSVAQVVSTYMQAIAEGADVILSICSTVEDIAYQAQDVARYAGIPIIRVNEAMCREAVKKGKNIAIVSTFSTSLAPTKNTLQQVSRELGKPVNIEEVLVEGGFGLEQHKFKALMAEKIREAARRADVILFTQGSMAYCEPYIEKLFKKEVLTNPYYSARAVKEALIAKGLLKE